jgi:hypothetical protein
MKKRIALILATVMCVLMLAGCDEASRVSHNLSEQADNFNIVRKITVINCIQGDILFQMTGKMSINADVQDNQLEITVEDNNIYTKHFIGLSDNVTYVVEDLGIGANDVDKYHYTLNYNPKMWLPIGLDNID